MRVAFNALAATRGGAVTQLRPFLAALRRVRPEWDLLLFVSNPSLVQRLDSAIVHHIAVRGAWSRAYYEFFGIERLARRSSADCIVNLLNSGPLRPHVPMITWQRNALYFDRQWLAEQPPRFRLGALVRRWVALICCRTSQLTVVPSHAMAQLISDWPLGRRLPVRVISHGVDLQRFSFAPRQDRNEILTIGVMGHPAAHRGLDVAVKALDEVRRAGVAARLLLTIARDNNPAFQPLVDEVAQLARRLGLAEHVEFGGPADDAAEWYRSLDVLLVPSQCESFGFPLLEGLAVGVPVLASDLPALVEVGDTAARYSARGDAPAIANSIIQLATEPFDTITERLARGRELAENKTWGASASVFADVVEELLQMR